MWYRWQALRTIATAVWADVREQKLRVAGAIVLWFGGMWLLTESTASIRQALFLNFFNREWQSEVLRQFWVYYGVPFVLLLCIGNIAMGWLIAKVNHRYGMAMVMVCLAAQVMMAANWGWRTWNLLEAGLWPFWDYRLALIFQAFCVFALYPLCLLLGASWRVIPITDAE
jgi:hypothetical protein